MKDKLKQLLIELVYWQNENTPKADRVDYTYSQILTLIKDKMPPNPAVNLEQYWMWTDVNKIFEYGEKVGRSKAIDDCMKAFEL